jgi:hypothetical protein
MTTADYLNQLEQDRQDLVDNLETKGITGLTGDETFTELVPEVLNISGGGGGTGPLPTNLRHIQVGDNLYNKKLYFTFPSNINELISQYHLSFGDSGITWRIFISTTELTNPIDFTSFPNGDFALSTYNTTNYSTWGSVAINHDSRGYFFVCCNTSDTYSYLGIDLSKDSRCNVNKEIAYIDTNNPAYQYVWVEDEPEPQLRNIQVGDVLAGKTVYFNIPDNFDYTDETDNGTFVTVDNSRSASDYNDTFMNYGYGSLWVLLYEQGTYSSDYHYVVSGGTQNEDTYTIPQGYGWDQPVSSIDTNNPMYQYVYVDTNEMGD